MATYQVDPISRIEGHLGVKLTTAGSGSGAVVTGADVHGNLWRGFENFLIGRVPNDAITFTQRICGVCPVPHGMASTFAVEAAIGYNDNFQTFVSGTSGHAGYGVPEKALHVRNLILGSEFLMSSLTHFYHLAAPSYVQGPGIPPWTPYFNQNFYHPFLQAAGKGLDATGTAGTANDGALPALGSNGFSADLWSAVITQYVTALRIRRLTFEAGAMFAGRMPMTSAFIAGGVGFNHNTDLTSRTTEFRAITSEIGDFVVRQYVPLVLALGALYPDYDNSASGTVNGYGAGCGNFLAWGGFPQADGTLAAGFARGWRRLGAVGGMGTSGNAGITVANVQSFLKEDITRSRYTSGAAGQGYNGTDVEYPGDVSRTIPIRTDTNKYSWLKAPRWDGHPMEVGPMARMYVSTLFQYQQPLAGTVNHAGITGYTDYVKSGGLDPKMVHPDLAVACVVSGLAKLVCPAGTVANTSGGGQLNVSNLSFGTIATQYADASSYIIDGDTAPLVSYIIGLHAGLSTMDRLRGRALESLVLVQQMIGMAVKPVNAATDSCTFPAGGWCDALAAVGSSTDASYNPVATPTSQVLAKFGAAEAPRGALMHFISINNGKILKYQCVVPTTWNGSPKDASGTNGPIEQAMIGIPFDETLTSPAYTAGTGSTISGAMGGVEALRVAQSFDPCIACAVH